jgi:hypothetical protein
MAVTRTSTHDDEKTLLLTLEGERFSASDVKSILKGWQLIVTTFGTIDDENYAETADYLEVPIGFNDEDDELTLRFRGRERMVKFFTEQLEKLGLKTE